MIKIRYILLYVFMEFVNGVLVFLLFILLLEFFSLIILNFDILLYWYIVWFIVLNMVILYDKNLEVKIYKVWING